MIDCQGVILSATIGSSGYTVWLIWDRYISGYGDFATFVQTTCLSVSSYQQHCTENCHVDVAVWTLFNLPIVLCVQGFYLERAYRLTASMWLMIPLVVGM
jgi:hypothetical protein